MDRDRFNIVGYRENLILSVMYGGNICHGDEQSTHGEHTSWKNV